MDEGSQIGAGDMADEMTRTNSNDESMHATGSNNVTSIRLVGYDRPFFTAMAIALSILAVILAYMAFHEATVDEYWMSRTEAFLEQMSAQGVHVPPDLLPHKERSQ
jgi:hypothetical protein